MDVIQGLDAITVHLTAPHAASARRFYGSILGLKELSWDEAQGRGARRVPGGATLIAQVMQPNEPGRAPGTPTGIMFHVSNVHQSVAEIKARGGKITDEPWEAGWGPLYATVADPDGNEWVLIQR